MFRILIFAKVGDRIDIYVLPEDWPNTIPQICLTMYIDISVPVSLFGFVIEVTAQCTDLTDHTSPE